MRILPSSFQRFSSTFLLYKSQKTKLPPKHSYDAFLRLNNLTESVGHMIWDILYTVCPQNRIYLHTVYTVKKTLETCSVNQDRC